MNKTISDFGLELDRRMKAADISQAELSRRSGVDKNTIRKILHGQSKQPGINNVEKLRKALDAIENKGAALIGYVRGERVMLLTKTTPRDKLKRVPIPAGVAQAHDLDCLEVESETRKGFYPLGYRLFLYISERTFGCCPNTSAKTPRLVKIKGDEDAFLCRVRRGYTDRKYNLYFSNGDMLEEQEIDWCNRIASIQPGD